MGLRLFVAICLAAGTAALEFAGSETPSRFHRRQSLRGAARRQGLAFAPSRPGCGWRRHGSRGMELLRTRPKAGVAPRAGRCAMQLDGASIASGVGVLIGGASVFLYTPMMVRVCRKQSAAGLSPTTWLLKLGCYATTDAYNFSHGYALSSYSEIISLSVQAAAMLSLVCYFQRISWPLLVAAGVSGAAALAVGTADAGTLESGIIPAAQVAASVAGSAAVFPQLLENMRNDASGEFSPVSASMLALGNALRLWTTLELTQDPILLAGFGLGLGANSLLLAQIVWFASRDRVSLFDLYTSDLRDAPQAETRGTIPSSTSRDAREGLVPEMCDAQVGASWQDTGVPR